MQKGIYLILVSLIIMISIVVMPTMSSAITNSGTQIAQANEIQQKIDARNTDISNLEKEIAGYQKQIDALNSKANTLSETIKSLALTQKKLSTDIQVTEKKIQNKTSEIRDLASHISDHEEAINDDKTIISKIFLSINESRSYDSPISIILGQNSISKISDGIKSLADIQISLHDRIERFEKNKYKLESSKKTSEKARQELLALNKQLNDQKSVVKSTSDQQSQLLKKTQQSESEYQKILTEKSRLKEAIEREITKYESELKIAIDPSRLPILSSILSWPLKNIRITQLFGNTAFASSRPEIYNGKGHTGIDFAASIGTPVRAVLSGRISGTGNTDLIPKCYSYGKWIMIEHTNGLSSLYAHLSVISVSPGEKISTGQIIGYSGNTGYSTGPHLHFGLYATQGVEIKTFDNSKNCRGAIIPIAPFQAYLNPLSFLPKL